MRDSLDLILHASGPGRAAPPDMQFRFLAGLDSVNAAPGETWNYNNGGYILLSTVIERVAGRPLAEFFRERIFIPVGMHDTLLRALDTDLVPNSATLHVPAPGGGWTRGVFGTPIGGEGGIASTVDDMLRWLRHMSAPVVGTAATWEAMRTPLTTHGYGLGLSMGRYRGLSTVHHGGTVVGGASQMLKVLGHELDIVIMSNGHSSLVVHNLSDAIIDRCVAGLPPAEAAVREDAPVVRGTFYSRNSARVLGLVEHEGGQGIDFGGMTLPAGRDAEGALAVSLSLFSTASDLRLRTVGAGDAVTALDATEFGAQDRLERIESPADASADTIAGRYDCREAGMTAAIAASADATIAMHVTGELGDMDYALCPVGPDLWRGKATSSLPLTVTLEFDGKGFLLSTGRTNRLRFRRSA